MRKLLLPLAFLLLPAAAGAQPHGPYPGPFPGPEAWRPAPPPNMTAHSMQCRLTCKSNVQMLCCRSAGSLSCTVKGPCSRPHPPRSPYAPWW